MLKLALRQSDPKIADMLVPSCVYRCGCPEPNSCGICDNITPFTKIDLTDIATRYSLYNNYFYTKNKKRGDIMNDYTYTKKPYIILMITISILIILMTILRTIIYVNYINLI